MKKYFLYIAIFLTYTSSFVYGEILRGIHIVSNGNNQYESKLKANIDGMNQSLVILSDNIGIKSARLQTIPYSELTKVFAIDSIISEESFPERYTAEVNYKYDNFGVNQLLIKYGFPEVQKQFFNYIVIPVFKQKHVMYLLDANSEWLGAWIDHSKRAKKYGLLPIDPTKESDSITVNNLMNYSYLEFLNALRIKNFKNILIVVCEYFTREDGTMYFQVTTNEITPQSRNVTNTKYDIPHPDHSKDFFDKPIVKIIDQYGNGVVTKNSLDTSFVSERTKEREHSEMFDSLLDDHAHTGRLQKIKMQLEVFSQKDIEAVKRHLSSIKDITKFQINLDNNGKYQIELYVNSSLQKLSESLYLNGLSYSEYDDDYMLFMLDKNEGI